MKRNIVSHNKNFMKILMRPNSLNARLAFTLVEMLVVIAVIALLAAFSMPFIQSSINKANQAKCAGRLKSCMAAIHSHMADTAASQLILYYHDGATTKLWNTDLITGGYLKLQDSQDPVWPVKPNDTSNIYGAFQDGPPDVFVNQRAPGTLVPRGFNLRVRSVDKPAQTLVLANSNLSESRRNQYNSIYKNLASGEMIINLVYKGKANAVFLDGHVEVVDGPRYKEIISRMFGTNQTVSVFENGKVVRY